MASFNKVILLGNLTRDPESREIQGGHSVANFGLAVNKRWRNDRGEDQERVLFVECSAFNKLAQVVMSFCDKGKPVLIEGELQYNEWEKDGEKRSRVSVLVQRLQLLGSRDDSGGGRQGTGSNAIPQRNTQQGRPEGAWRGGQRAMENMANRSEPESPFSEEQQFKDDDIPF